MVFVAGLAAVLFLFNSTRHLTQTPPQKKPLIQGTNEFTFPVVRGRYLLRIGTPNPQPTPFKFSVKGRIRTPDEDLEWDEHYEPTPDVLSQKVSGGNIGKALKIDANEGQVVVHIDASFPVTNSLSISFQGIK